MSSRGGFDYIYPLFLFNYQMHLRKIHFLSTFLYPHTRKVKISQHVYISCGLLRDRTDLEMVSFSSEKCPLVEDLIIFTHYSFLTAKCTTEKNIFFYYRPGSDLILLFRIISRRTFYSQKHKLTRLCADSSGYRTNWAMIQLGTKTTKS